MQTKNDTVVQVHRVRLNSKQALLASGFLYAIFLSVVGMFDEGPFFVCLFGTVFLLAAGGAHIWAFLQTLVITPEEIKIKLAWITLRTIPLSEIKTIVYLSSFENLGDFYILSPKTQADIQDQGSAIYYKDPLMRSKWERMSRRATENVVKIRTYYYSCFQIGYMRKEEGIWLCTSAKNIEKIRHLCSHATYVTTW